MKKIADIIMPRLTEFDMLVNHSDLSSTVASSFSTVVYSIITSANNIDTALCNEIVSLMFFSYTPEAGKDCYSNDVGMQTSLFREKCLRNVMHHITKGFCLIKQAGTSYSPVKFPEWVKRIILTTEAIRQVRSRQESTGVDQEWKKRINEIVNHRSQLNSLDESIFVLESVNKSVVSLLNKTRKSVKRSFSRNFGYLFID